MYLKEFSDNQHQTYGDRYHSSSDNRSLASMSSASSLASRDHVIFANSSDESLPKAPTNHMTFNNVDDLCEDLKVIVTLRDMCDVTFLVGEEEMPVYGVRAILATRSRVMYNKFLEEDAKRQKDTKKSRGIFSKFFSCTSSQTKHDVYRKTTIAVPEADYKDFRSLVQYLHTGCAQITIENLPGILHLSYIYQVDDITHACMDFAHRHMKSTDRLLHLLNTLERHKYSEYVSRLYEEVLSLIDQEAETVLASDHLLNLNRDSAFSILLRPELNASETSKLSAILKWARNSTCKNNVDDFRHTVNILLTNVDLSKISPVVLKKDVLPLGVLPPDVIRSHMSGRNYLNSVVTHSDSDSNNESESPAPASSTDEDHRSRSRSRSTSRNFRNWSTLQDRETRSTSRKSGSRKTNDRKSRSLSKRQRKTKDRESKSTTKKHKSNNVKIRSPTNTRSTNTADLESAQKCRSTVKSHCISRECKRSKSFKRVFRKRLFNNTEKSRDSGYHFSDTNEKHLWDF